MVNHDIAIADVTTTLPDGSGVFDVLMRSMDSHLDKQYISGRIKGTEYATVYLGALQMVLQQSIQFVLSEKKAEKELDLITEQIAASKADTKRKDDQAIETNKIYRAQQLGFTRDFQLKVSRSLLDLRATGMTQGNAGITSVSGDAFIGKLMEFAELPFEKSNGQFLTDV